MNDLCERVRVREMQTPAGVSSLPVLPAFVVGQPNNAKTVMSRYVMSRRCGYRRRLRRVD